MIVTKFDFSKGAVHDLGQKFEISSLHFGKIGLEIVFGDILFLGKILIFFFFIFSFELNKPRKMFRDSLDKKQAFADFKNIDFA